MLAGNPPRPSIVFLLNRNDTGCSIRGMVALGERLVRGEPGFIAIGLGADNEPLFANIEDGRIYRFVWTAP